MLKLNYVQSVEHVLLFADWSDLLMSSFAVLVNGEKEKFVLCSIQTNIESSQISAFALVSVEKDIAQHIWVVTSVWIRTLAMLCLPPKKKRKTDILLLLLM